MNKFISIFSIKRLVDGRSFSMKFTADGKEIPKTKNFANRITLISSDNSVSITDLKTAQSISERRELKLVKIQDEDSKTRRPVYKLMSNAEYHKEELEQRKEKKNNNQSVKGEKFLSFSYKIGEHDLMTSIKRIMKLLDKQYEVRVVVSGESEKEMPQSEKIYSVIEKNLKSVGKIVQKRSKGNSLKFQLLPLKENSMKASVPNNVDNEHEGSKGAL